MASGPSNRHEYVRAQSSKAFYLPANMASGPSNHYEYVCLKVSKALQLQANIASAWTGAASGTVLSHAYLT